MAGYPGVYQYVVRWLSWGQLREAATWSRQEAYELAALRSKMFGFSWHVDHVLPLQGKLVSGLHTPYNLQVIPWVDNVRKANKFEAVT